MTTKKELEEDLYYRNKVRIASYEEFVHEQNYGTVSIVVRKTEGRKKPHFDIREVNVHLKDRDPNVPNIVLFNLDRAIADLQKIRDDIEEKRLYNL